MLESIAQGPTASVLTLEQKRIIAKRDMDGVKNEKNVLKIARIHAQQLILLQLLNQPPLEAFAK